MGQEVKNIARREERDHWITQEDDRLLAECHVDTYRASGPGGQKRNKTSSAVRVRHQPSGLMAIGEESRSQHENKARALRRVRMLIALEVRVMIDSDAPALSLLDKHRTSTGGIKISRRHEEYPLVMATLLDLLAHCNGGLRDAAAIIKISTGQFSKVLTEDDKVLDAANRIRKSHNLHVLTPSE